MSAFVKREVKKSKCLSFEQHTEHIDLMNCSNLKNTVGEICSLNNVFWAQK